MPSAPVRKCYPRSRSWQSWDSMDASWPWPRSGARCGIRPPLGIASQAALPYSSWPYDGFLERLLQQPAAKPAEVAEMLTKAFLEFYGGHLTQYVTMSVCDLALIQKFEDTVKPLAQALAVASADPQARQNIFEARRYCPEYDEQGFIDFGCFCRYLKITMPGSPVSAACDPALQALGDFVIGSGYSPPKPNMTIALSSGLSVWLPPWIQDPDAFAIEKKPRGALSEQWLPQNAVLANYGLGQVSY